MNDDIGAQPTPRPVRLNRSQLAVPGSSRRYLEKAAASAADVVMIDLEDSVSPPEKERARAEVVRALEGLDWGDRTVSVRVNGLDTAWMYRDVIEILEACPRVDLLVIPKVGLPQDVYAVEVLVSQVEQARGGDRRVGLEALIETALGMANVEAIAGASRRLEALSFGAGDYAASVRARTTGIGAPNPDYGMLSSASDPGASDPGASDPGASDPDTSDRDAPERGAGDRTFHPADMWHYPQSRMLVACRAHGLRPVDGPFGDFRDPEGFRSAARRAAALGFEGKWAIHPSQVPIANEVFSPTAAEIGEARRIVEAMAEARREGRGAASLDGRMIDAASLRMAENVVGKAEAIERRAAGGEPA